MKYRQAFMALAILAALALTGCVAAQFGGSKINLKPVANTCDAMSQDDVAIATAVAVQAATPPLDEYRTVRFEPTAMGSSRPELGAEQFEFTGAKLYARKGIIGNMPGVSMGEVEMTDPLGRRATVLYEAEYLKQDGIIELRKLNMAPTYADVPRVDVTIVRVADMAGVRIGNYAELVAFLADKGIAPADLSRSGMGEYAIFAVGRDWAGPDSKMTIAISASRTGTTGHTKGTDYKLLNGMWPVAVAFGSFDPSSAKDELYAKVSYRKEGGFGSSVKIGVYKLVGK